MQKKKFKVTPLERAWILYDVGNSAFVLMIATLVPIFFNALAEAGGVSKVNYLAYWGYASSVVTVITAVLGPILGTLADTKNFKKPIFMLCLFVGVLGCCAMGAARTWLPFLVVFIVAKIGFSGSLVFYDSMLGDVLSFTDGKVVKPMVSSMDHKRANDHDTGLNTGGMGTVAPNPYYTPEIAAECMEKIFLPTIHAMNAEGCPFKGCLYFGLMLTPDGPKVIEYNCRFGDPETQVVLPLLEGDLLHIMEACTNGTLADEDVKFSDGAAACVILASGGYPVAYEKGKPISGLVDGQLPDEENVTVYHSGTALTEDGTLVTNGGRVLGVTATGPRLTNALSHAYEAAEKIHFDKLHKRSDIGLRALKALAEKQ